MSLNVLESPQTCMIEYHHRSNRETAGRKRTGFSLCFRNSSQFLRSPSSQALPLAARSDSWWARWPCSPPTWSPDKARGPRGRCLPMVWQVLWRKSKVWNYKGRKGVRRWSASWWCLVRAKSCFIATNKTRRWFNNRSISWRWRNIRNIFFWKLQTGFYKFTILFMISIYVFNPLFSSFFGIFFTLINYSCSWFMLITSRFFAIVSMDW